MLSTYLEKILEKYSRDIDSILLAIPSLRKRQKKELINSIQKYNVPILEVPSIEEIASGEANVEELRTIEIEELLGRETKNIESLFINKNLF